MTNVFYVLDVNAVADTLKSTDLMVNLVKNFASPFFFQTQKYFSIFFFVRRIVYDLFGVLSNSVVRFSGFN